MASDEKIPNLQTTKRQPGHQAKRAGGASHARSIAITEQALHQVGQKVSKPGSTPHRAV